jgi:RND family efflux transporter MFP subunit
MKKRRAVCFAFLVVLAGFVSGCRASRSDEVETDGGARTADTPSVVRLTEDAIRIAGIQTEKAALRRVPLKIHETGDLSFNQKRLMNLTARAAGRIENIYAFEGDRVREGEILISLYSPDFLTSQAEFLQAAARLERLTRDGLHEEIPSAKSLLDSARSKLILLGVNEGDLTRLEETRRIMPLLQVRAPFSGTVIESPIVLGDLVAEGATLFKIVDLSVLWGQVHVYEKDLSRVRQGMPALVKVHAYPGQTFHGTLTLLADVMDEKTHTVIARVEVQNSHGLLRPGMYAEVELVLASRAEALLVPEAAVQDLEGKTVVFVPAGERSFRTQEVELGQKLNGWVEVVKGLSAGDLYVRDGFLLKSEILKKNLEVD